MYKWLKIIALIVCVCVLVLIAFIFGCKPAASGKVVKSESQSPVASSPLQPASRASHALDKPQPTAHDEEYLNIIGAIVSDTSITRREKIKKLFEIYNKHESLIISDAALDGLGVLSPIESTDALIKILTNANAYDSTKAKAVTALYNGYVIPWDIASKFSSEEAKNLVESRLKISKTFTDILLSGRSGEAVTSALLFSYGTTNSLEDNKVVFQQIKDGVIPKSEAAVQFAVTAAMSDQDKQNTLLPLLFAHDNPLDQNAIATELSKNIVNELGSDKVSAGNKKAIIAYLDAHQPTVSDEISGSDANFAYWQLARQMMISSSKSEALAVLAAHPAK